MPVKVTFIFSQQNASGKTGGWSETWYYQGSASEIDSATSTYMVRRAGMLSSFCTIQGFRIQDIPGRGRFVSASVQGNFNSDPDIPQMALNCRCNASGFSNYKFFQLRGIPDGQVISGRYFPQNNYPQAVAQFFTHLVNQGWRFRAVKMDNNPQVKILSVAADGTFKIAAGLTFVAGQYFDFLRCKGVDGSKLSGRYFINSKVDNENGKLLNWPGTLVAERGTARVFALEYPQIATGTIAIYGVTTRKVGRPFFLYRGRQTQR